MVCALGSICYAFVVSTALADKVLRMGLANFADGGGNPYTALTLPRTAPWQAVFDPLTMLDADGQPQPWLATAWHNPDALTWVFDLRGGIRFSNGEPFDAHAVHAAIRYLISPAANRDTIGRELSKLAGSRVIDDHRIEVRTTSPDAMLARRFSALRIPAPGVWRKLGAAGFARSPVGTGPFKVASWRPDRISVVSNRDAWHPPQVDALEFYEIADQSARLQGLLSGQINIAMAIGAADNDAVQTVGGRLYTERTARVSTVAFVTVRPSPLRDPRVRLALNHAVNKQLIIDTILNGATKVATQAAPSMAFGYNPELEAFAYDPERARQLLAEAGFADGFELTMTVVAGSGGSDSEYYQAIAADLRRVGVDVELRAVRLSQLVRYIYEGGWPGEAFGIDYGTEPALDGLRPFRMHSCLWIKPWHCDRDMTERIEAAWAEFDLDRRRELVHSILQSHHDAPPGILLWEMVRFDGLAREIVDYSVTAGVIRFDKIRLRR